jgi:hypothetical protein
MELITAPKARAYVYAGNWVADCPREGCGNVEHLFDRNNPGRPDSPRTVRKTMFHCSYCRLVAEIEWAPDEASIMAVLDLRPVPHNRNWYPHEHATALRFRLPHGQTVAELREENAEHGVPVS